jgi:HEAT repeat protein
MKNSALEVSSPSPDAPRDAEGVVRQLLLVFKNYGFYPEDHTTCRNVLAAFQETLRRFLETHGPLRLTVEKGRLLFGDTVVHDGGERSGELDQVLFRDGLRAIEFEPGIDASGVQAFCRLLNRYRILDEEAEGDLVTGLWSAGIPHLKYDAMIYWEAPPLESFPALTPDAAAPSAADLADAAHNFARQGKNAAMGETIPDSVTELSESEVARLREMVQAEEKWDAMTDVFDIFLILLDHQDSPAGFQSVVDHLVTEFRDTLAEREFDLSRKLLLELEKIRRDPGPDREWAVGILDDFFERVSTEDHLAVLGVGEPAIDRLTKAQFEDLFKTLALLRPGAAAPVAQLLPAVETRPARRVLMEAITRLIRRDLSAVEPLLAHPDEALVSKLLERIAGIPDEAVTDQLTGLLAHESPAIRRKALQILLERAPSRWREIFPLIEDPSEPIRRMVLTHLSRARSVESERMLRGYLENGNADAWERAHRTACFRALGRCGSARSVPFLKNTLLEHPLSDLISRDKSGRRADAALALSLLETEAAREVLRRGRKSRFPQIRRACAAVWKESP